MITKTVTREFYILEIHINDCLVKPALEKKFTVPLF
jgi:hypothetical protein